MFITATSSATSIASSWSCVTITVVDVRLVVEPAQPLAQLGPHARVERAERLVEEEHGRVDRQRAGEAHPLPLSARELRRVALGEPVELDELEELVHALLDLRLRPLADLSPNATLSWTVMCLNAA